MTTGTALNYPRMHRRQRLARARNAAMRTALATGLAIKFDDLGHYQVRAWYSADGTSWHVSPADAARLTFIPVTTWASGLTCFGCGNQVALNTDHLCPACWWVRTIRGEA